MIRMILFALGTWGLILGVPVVAFIALRPHRGAIVAALVSVGLLAVGALFGEGSPAR